MSDLNSSCRKWLYNTAPMKPQSAFRISLRVEELTGERRRTMLRSLWKSRKYQNASRATKDLIRRVLMRLEVPNV